MTDRKPGVPRVSSRTALASLAALAAAPLASLPFGTGFSAPAPDLSGKPIRLIVPFTAGGSSDIIARAIAQVLSEDLGATVVVENRVGANGNIGAAFVANAEPDGHTLLLCDVRALAISPALYKLPFDPSTALTGVAMLAYSPHLLVVNPSIPANTLPELLELAKQKQMFFAVTALGSAPHLAGIELQEKTKAAWQYVPYKGGSQAVNDTVAGQTNILMNGMLATLPFVKSKQLKILAVSKPTRVDLLPDVPTIAETVPGFESGTWQGVMAPAGLPPAVLERLSAALIKAIQAPSVKERLTAQGAEVSTMPTREIGAFYAKERKHWADVVARANIKIE